MLGQLRVVTVEFAGFDDTHTRSFATDHPLVGHVGLKPGDVITVIDVYSPKWHSVEVGVKPAWRVMTQYGIKHVWREDILKNSKLP